MEWSRTLEPLCATRALFGTIFYSLIMHLLFLALVKKIYCIRGLQVTKTRSKLMFVSVSVLFKCDLVLYNRTNVFRSMWMHAEWNAKKPVFCSTFQVFHFMCPSVSLNKLPALFGLKTVSHWLEAFLKCFGQQAASTLFDISSSWLAISDDIGGFLMRFKHPTPHLKH